MAGLRPVPVPGCPARVQPRSHPSQAFGSLKVKFSLPLSSVLLSKMTCWKVGDGIHRLQPATQQTEQLREEWSDGM